MAEAAVRECLEETGLLIELTDYLGDVDEEHQRVRYYGARRVGGIPVVTDADDGHQTSVRIEHPDVLFGDDAAMYQVMQRRKRTRETYNPGQPRHPAGTPDLNQDGRGDGGQFAATGQRDHMGNLVYAPLFAGELPRQMAPQDAIRHWTLRSQQERGIAEVTRLAESLQVELDTVPIEARVKGADEARGAVLTLSVARANEIATARGLGPVEFVPIARALWTEWRKGAAGPYSMALQEAVYREFMAHSRLTPEQRAMPAGAGIDQRHVAAYARALWEVSQWALARANAPEMLRLYRAVYLPRETILEGGSDSKRPGRLPTLALKQTGVSSWTSKLDVANTWLGNKYAGGVPEGHERVVVRADIPRHALLSLPVYGKDRRGKHEYVVLGVPWKAWDAWKGTAPRTGLIESRAGRRAREAYNPDQPRHPAGTGDVVGGPERDGGKFAPKDDPTSSTMDPDALAKSHVPGADKIKDLPEDQQKFLRDLADDPDIIAAREKLFSEETTEAKYKGDGTWPLRRELHEQITGALMNPLSQTAPGEVPRLVMIIGMPAAGKTGVLRDVIPPGNFTAIDADDIKQRLPEYNGANAGAVHEESSYIAEKIILARAYVERRHVLLDSVGKNPKKLLTLARNAKRLGYHVELYHVTIPPLRAAERAIERFRKEGRFVDPVYILAEVDGAPDRTYEELKRSGNVDQWVSYDNDVGYKEPPRLRDRGRRKAA